MGSHASSEPVRAVLDCVRRIVRALRESSREAERKVGISGAQLFVLQQLAAGPARSVSELSERTLTHQSSVSAVVQRLAAAGLIARTRSPTDRRRRDLRLTARGRALVSSAPPLLQDRLIEAVRQLSPGRRLRLASGLLEVVTRMQLPGGAPPMFFEDRVRRGPRPPLAAVASPPRRSHARR
jgi:MarR family transcriptional regulator, lower aerobic nicotinate degradation pathway regulator